jgi:uncharacterized cupin superfamily protein
MKPITYPITKMEDTEWGPVAPEKVLSGMPRCTYKILYTDPSKEFYTGVYECSPGKWRVHYEEDEFCALHEGHVRITTADGLMYEFKAPECYTLPAGFDGTFEALTYVRKYFAIYEKLK